MVTIVREYGFGGNPIHQYSLHSTLGLIPLVVLTPALNAEKRKWAPVRLDARKGRPDPLLLLLLLGLQFPLLPRVLFSSCLPFINVPLFDEGFFGLRVLVSSKVFRKLPNQGKHSNYSQ